MFLIIFVYIRKNNEVVLTVLNTHMLTDRESNGKNRGRESDSA